MARVTRKQLESRTELIANALVRLHKLPVKSTVHLSCYRPGDGSRWQIQVLDRESGGVDACFPRAGHYLTRDFDCYLDGLTDALDIAEGRYPLLKGR